MYTITKHSPVEAIQYNVSKYEEEIKHLRQKSNTLWKEIKKCDREMTKLIEKSTSLKALIKCKKKLHK